MASEDSERVILKNGFLWTDPELHARPQWPWDPLRGGLGSPQSWGPWEVSGASLAAGLSLVWGAP